MLSDQDHLTPAHRRILLLAWAGWLFDFYDLILYSFLLTEISRELHLAREEHSLVLGFSLGMTAGGGVLFGVLADRFGGASRGSESEGNGGAATRSSPRRSPRGAGVISAP